MANNFKFLSNRIRDRIRLKLYGDFDGSSAFELINILKNYRNGSNQIFIDTNNLNTVHPFGMDVFKKNLSVLDILTGWGLVTMLLQSYRQYAKNRCAPLW